MYEFDRASGGKSFMDTISEYLDAVLKRVKNRPVFVVVSLIPISAGADCEDIIRSRMQILRCL
jgi:uncharacterized Fe-S center protein